MIALLSTVVDPGFLVGATASNLLEAAKRYASCMLLKNAKSKAQMCSLERRTEGQLTFWTNAKVTI